MTNRYSEVCKQLLACPRTWLVTGVAGFIGSNLLETLLRLNQHVVGLDNFSTGYPENLNEIRERTSVEQWKEFEFVKGDIRDLLVCREAVRGVNYVLHHAALGSVPRSLDEPTLTNDVNVGGFVNMLVAAREEFTSCFVYATSSSIYGDVTGLPKVEHRTGNPLSPYAVTKYANEAYASVFACNYGLRTVGLRYFNVFGRRQDPRTQYAAVIPAWISALIHDEDVFINGDGESSRDFCFVDNVVQANILAATTNNLPECEVFNIAVGERTTLNQLYEILKSALSSSGVHRNKAPIFRDYRLGDVRHSLADISKAEKMLGYSDAIPLREGIMRAIPWYVSILEDRQRQPK